MKRLTVLILTLMTALSLVACEGKTIVTTPEGVTLEGEDAKKWLEEHHMNDDEEGAEPEVESAVPEEDTEELEDAPEDLQEIKWDYTGFSTRVPASCEYEFDEKNGLYIYTLEYNCYPFVKISRHDSEKDAKKFIKERILPEFENDKEYEMLTTPDIREYEVGGKKLTGVHFTYFWNGDTIDYLCVLETVDTGLVKYVCKTSADDKKNKDFCEEVFDDAVRYFEMNVSSKKTSEAPADEPSDVKNVETPSTGAANIKYAEVSNDYFSMNIPEGWTAQVLNNDPISYTIEVSDPDHPDRSMIYCSCMGGMPKSKEAHDFRVQYFPGTIFAEMPYLTEISTEGFFKGTQEYFGYSNYKTLQNNGRTQYGGDLLLGSAISGKTGNEVKGILTAWVYDTGVDMENKNPFDWSQGKVDVGFAQASVIVMELAPSAEYKEWVPVLNNCFASLKFTDKYRKDYKETWEAVMLTSADLTAIADETRAVVSQSWIDFL